MYGVSKGGGQEVGLVWREEGGEITEINEKP